MNLTSLVLENFGRFENFECDFTNGINVVKGGNETGKSTLVAAIMALFYSDPSSGEIVKAKTWGISKPLVIRGKISDESFYGVLEKDFDAGHAKLENQKHGISIKDQNKVTQIMSNSLGFPTAELFEATSCIRQGEIARIKDSVEAIKDKLGSLVTGGKEDVTASQIISTIDRRVANIMKSDNGNPGQLKVLEKQQADLDYNIDRINREINNLRTWRTSLAQVQIAHKNSIEDHHDKDQRLNQAIKAQKHTEELKVLLKQKEDISESLKGAKSFSQRTEDIARALFETKKIAPPDLAKLEDLESTIRYLRPKFDEHEEEASKAKRSYDSTKVGGALIAWLLFSIGAMALAAADFYLKFTPYYLQVGLGGIVSATTSILVLSRVLQKRSFLKQQMLSAKDKLRETQEHLEKNHNELKALLARYQISSTDEGRRLYWKRSELENQLKTETAKYQGLLSGSSIDDIERKVQELEKKISDNKTALENLVPLAPTELDRLKLVVSQLAQQKDTLETEIRSLDRQIETAEGGSELLASYLERKEQITSQKNALVEELATLSMTKEYIEKARQSIMMSTLELLEKRTSEMLEIITSGKYRRVQFDKMSLGFKVYCDKKEDWVDPHVELSRETVEQIYLTARLALTEILAGEVTPPIILDDPFVGFDEARRENTMKVLKQMAEKRQVVLLTTDESYDRWADNTIVLTS